MAPTNATRPGQALTQQRSFPVLPERRWRGCGVTGQVGEPDYMARGSSRPGRREVAPLAYLFVASRSGQRRRPAPAGKGRPKRPSGSQNRLRFATPRPRCAAPPALVAWTSRGPLGAVSTTSGIPGWSLVTGGAIWLAMIILWVAGATKGSFAVFLGAFLQRGHGNGLARRHRRQGKGSPQGSTSGPGRHLAAAVPVFFDPHGGDVFNLPKYTLVVVGALVLAGLWVVASVHHRGAPPVAQWAPVGRRCRGGFDRHLRLHRSGRPGVAPR